MILCVFGGSCGTTPEAPQEPAAPSEADGTEAPDAPQGWVLTKDYKLPAEYLRELVFFPPPEWIVETPSAETRKGQYRLPHVDGDAEDAWVVVDFFVLEEEGDRDARRARYAGRFEQPDGSSSADALKCMSSAVMSYYQDSMGKPHEWCRTFTRIDISGTYVGETNHGSIDHQHKEGWRMLVTIIGAGCGDASGPYYVELVGPAATVAYWAPSYGRFVESAKPLR
jgi:hypothetical protein